MQRTIVVTPTANTGKVDDSYHAEWAGFKSSFELRGTGKTEEEAIGSLIMRSNYRKLDFSPLIECV